MEACVETPSRRGANRRWDALRRGANRRGDALRRGANRRGDALRRGVLQQVRIHPLGRGVLPTVGLQAWGPVVRGCDARRRRHGVSLPLIGKS